jgi:hypothetical protein
VTDTPILRHFVSGPFEDGTYMVLYSCDHTAEFTVAGDGFLNRESAEREAERLNAEQLAREKAIQAERQLRGFHAKEQR